MAQQAGQVAAQLGRVGRGGLAGAQVRGQEQPGGLFYPSITGLGPPGSLGQQPDRRPGYLDGLRRLARAGQPGDALRRLPDAVQVAVRVAVGLITPAGPHQVQHQPPDGPGVAAARGHPQLEAPPQVPVAVQQPAQLGQQLGPGQRLQPAAQRRAPGSGRRGRPRLARAELAGAILQRDQPDRGAVLAEQALLALRARAGPGQPAGPRPQPDVVSAAAADRGRDLRGGDLQVGHLAQVIPGAVERLAAGRALHVGPGELRDKRHVGH